jgi:hypothetical protein
MTSLNSVRKRNASSASCNKSLSTLLYVCGNFHALVRAFRERIHIAFSPLASHGTIVATSSHTHRHIAVGPKPRTTREDVRNRTDGVTGKALDLLLGKRSGLEAENGGPSGISCPALLLPMSVTATDAQRNDPDEFARGKESIPFSKVSIHACTTGSGRLVMRILRYDGRVIISSSMAESITIGSLHSSSPSSTRTMGSTCEPILRKD